MEVRTTARGEHEREFTLCAFIIPRSTASVVTANSHPNDTGLRAPADRTRAVYGAHEEITEKETLDC